MSRIWSLSQTAAPAAKPLAQQRVLNHCRIDLAQPGCDADTVNGWIDTAAEEFEKFTGRQLIHATYEMHLDRWPCGYIAIPKPPLSSVTHIKYYAPGEATLTTWDSANYIVDAPSGPKAQNGRIMLSPTGSYPSVETRPGAIVVTFVAGYGAADTAIPEAAKNGMLILCSGFNEKREGGMDLKTAERVWSGFVTYMPEMR